MQADLFDDPFGDDSPGPGEQHATIQERVHYDRGYVRIHYLSRMIDATLQMPTNSAVAVFLGSLMSDNRSALAKIDRPTLIVVARVPAWMSLYEDLQKGIRGSRMEVFEDAGHALFVDEAPKFNRLLEDFLTNRNR